MSVSFHNLRFLVLAVLVYTMVLTLSLGSSQEDTGLDRQSLYHPVDDEVLLTLPVDWTQTKLAVRSKKLSDDEKLKTIDQWILMAKQRQDSRYLGFAADWIHKLLDEEGQLKKINALRYRQADISQYEHNFDAAIKKLTQIIESETNQFNAILFRSNLYTITGAYERALKDCQQLQRTGLGLIYFTCVTQNTSRQGKLQAEYGKLKALLQNQGESVTPWSYSIAADMARRSGMNSESLRWIEEGLAQNPLDRQLQIAKADLLIDMGACADIGQWIPGSNLGEIYILLIQAKCNVITDQSIKQVRFFVQQFNHVKQASDHRLLAELYFYVLKDAQAAQYHAQRNWQAQKEPEDFRLAYRIARTYKDSRLLGLLQDWKKRNRYEDAGLLFGGVL